VTSVGALLAWQNATGRWETWAYAWALIGPTASGVGSFIGGLRTGNRKMRDAGLWQIVIGLALFVGFYLFFEQVIGLSGEPAPLPDWVMPLVLVGLGVLILLRAFIGPRDTDPPT
jgi:O-antigen/teichoic acid export membrane protein